MYWFFKNVYTCDLNQNSTGVSACQYTFTFCFGLGGRSIDCALISIIVMMEINVTSKPKAWTLRIERARPLWPWLPQNFRPTKGALWPWAGWLRSRSRHAQFCKHRSHCRLTDILPKVYTGWITGYLFLGEMSEITWSLYMFIHDKLIRII